MGPLPMRVTPRDAAHFYSDILAAWQHVYAASEHHDQCRARYRRAAPAPMLPRRLETPVWPAALAWRRNERRKIIKSCLTDLTGYCAPSGLLTEAELM